MAKGILEHVNVTVSDPRGPLHTTSLTTGLAKQSGSDVVIVANSRAEKLFAATEEESLAMLLKLLDLGITDREIYLYDTFEGMTAPTESDTSAFEASALDTWQSAQSEGKRGWDKMFSAEVYTLDTVKALLESSGYPTARLHFIKGPVEQTIPGTVPEGIALLRLDTDWYESTRHEMEHLYPRLAAGGVLIIDDYGHWEGCRKAVDEYFGARAPRPLLNRIDYNARIAVKT